MADDTLAVKFAINKKLQTGSSISSHMNMSCTLVYNYKTAIYYLETMHSIKI